MKFFKNMISAPRGCAMIAAILIAVIALPAASQAQLASYTARTGKLVSGAGLPYRVTYKPGLFINGTFSGVLGDTATAAHSDTLIIPGYRQGMRVLVSRVTKHAATPATPPAPTLGHMATDASVTIKRDTVIFNFWKADTATYNFLITDR